MTQPLHELWESALGRLSSKVSPQNFDMWLRPIEFVSDDAGTLQLRAPNSYVRLWFESNYLEAILDEIRTVSGVPIRVDSYATLEPQGITGVNYIQITAGSPNSALLKEQYPDNVVPVLQSQPSPIAELLSGSGTVLAQTVDALNRINRVLSCIAKLVEGVDQHNGVTDHHAAQRHDAGARHDDGEILPGDQHAQNNADRRHDHRRKRDQ